MMNDERTILINAVMTGQLSATDAAPVLDALLRLERGRGVVVEPPCRLPPWLAGDGQVNGLLLARDAAVLLPTSSHLIGAHLARRNMDRLTVHLSALDVMYLADFWTDCARTRFMVGSVVLEERDGALHREWVDVAANMEAVALWLFGQPFPIQRQAAHQSDPATDDREALLVETLDEPDVVRTALGAFHGCLRVHSGRPPSPDERASINSLAVWLAPGIGPVRVRRERGDGSVEQVDLSAFFAPNGEGFFPLSPGFWWRFDSQASGGYQCELWRALVHPDPRSIWMATSAFRTSDD